MCISFRVVFAVLRILRIELSWRCIYGLVFLMDICWDDDQTVFW